ncbi:putative transcription factor homeobox-WOX family [Helianthus debilis subsp. tardiflorus]
MVHEISCITSLNLSLGCYDIPIKHRLDPQDHDRDRDQDKSRQQPEKKSVIKLDQPLPSLILGFGRDQDLAKLIQQPLPSIGSVVSSYSNSTSAKRQIIDDSSEEVDMDRNEFDGGVRKKLRLTKEQSFVLEESFKQHTTLNPKEKLILAKSLKLRPRQVEVWFQNRRARTKLKQNEVESALLKKFCEALTSDNLRLKREIQQLKDIKSSGLPAHLYMQFPSAGNRIMCPSCERNNSGFGDSGRDTTKSSKTS